MQSQSQQKKKKIHFGVKFIKIMGFAKILKYFGEGMVFIVKQFYFRSVSDKSIILKKIYFD